jgi:23S rRNA pseudouridine1911/1915/1917 synthase
MKKWTYQVLSCDEGKTIEQILRAAGFTKKEISRQKFLPEGITLEGEKARVTRKVHAGESISLNIPQDQEGISQAPSQVEICYEDEDLLIAYKPSGLSCHPGKGHYQDNMGSRVQAYCKNKGENVTIRPVGRLDKDTSGLMVFAKSQMAAARLWKQKEQGILQKIYVAVVHGKMEQESGMIDACMEKVPGEKNRMRTTDKGMRAVTHYQVIDTGTFHGQDISILECWLDTGRTHQIRVHMASIGHPLTGDVIYGTEDEEVQLGLHAKTVFLRQPFSGKPLSITREKT